MKRFNLSVLAVVFSLSPLWVGSAWSSSSVTPAFGPGVTVVSKGGSRPTVALDEKGNGYIVWVGSASGAADGPFDVYLVRMGREGLSEPIRVNSVAGAAAPHSQAPAQVAVGPEGHVYVVWQTTTTLPGRRFPASDLSFARSTDGGWTFEPTIAVNDDAGGLPSSHTFHDLAVGPDGTIYVSWLDGRERDRVLAQRKAEVAGSTGAATAESSAAVGKGHGLHKAGDGAAEMAVGGEGHGLRKAGDGAAEKATGGHGGHGGGKEDEAGLPGSEVWVASSTDGGKSFGTGVVVGEGVCPCCRTAVEAGANGVVLVLWRHVFPGDVRDIVLARSEDKGLTFGAPVRVHSDDWKISGCPHAGPDLAIDGPTSVRVLWYTGREQAPGVYSVSSQDGGRTFGTAVPLITGEGIPASQVSVVSDGAGGAWLAYEDAVDARIRTGHSRPGAAPSLEEEALDGTQPSIAFRGGNRLLAWLDGEAVRVRIARSLP